MNRNHKHKTESKIIATAPKLLKFPMSSKEPKILKYLWLNRFLKTTYKRTGFEGKTLWDWIQLFAKLAIPVVVAFVSISVSMQLDASNQRQHQTELKIAQDNRQNDIQIAINQQQGATLKAYLDNMTNLLLNNKLHESKPGDEVRNVARAQTLSVLKRLDPDRKVIVLHFIYEAGLISIIRLDDAELSIMNLKNPRPMGYDDIRDFSLQYANLANDYIENYRVEYSSFEYTNLSYSTLKHIQIISSNLKYVILNHTKLFDINFINCSLIGADLSSATLSNVNLTNADLSNANFRGATLSNVNLTNADLSSANFRGAKVTSEQLAHAKSLKGTIMPDGSTHP